MPTIATSTPEAFEAFRQAFESQGLRAALAELLAHTEYRFLGLWRFQDGRAAAAIHVDREDPDSLRTAEVPDTATYCSFVREQQRPFATVDAGADARLADHPARDTVRSYCGVPIMTSEGEVLGTLCHYDLVPRDFDQINLELMLMVSSFIARDGRMPGYPEAL